MKLNKNKYCVRFFHVGNETKGGDAILTELFDEGDNPFVILIDGGYKETGEKICQYIKTKYNNNPVIHLMVNTHPDIDHTSGLRTILENDDIEVKKIMMNRPWKDAGLKPEHFKDGRITENSLASRLRDAFAMADDIENIAGKKKIPVCRAFQGEVLEPDVLTVLGPTKTSYKNFLIASGKTPEAAVNELNAKSYQKVELEEEIYYEGGNIKWFDEEETSEVNQTSLVLSLQIGKKHFLLTGDASKATLTNALNFYENLHWGNSSRDFTVVQLPHHGSRKNINPDILNRLSPASYIISCPPDGMKEGHPSRRLINKILEIKKDSRIFVTGKHNFVFYKGIDINATPQTPQGKYSKMDGKPKP